MSRQSGGIAAAPPALLVWLCAALSAAGEGGDWEGLGALTGSPYWEHWEGMGALTGSTGSPYWEHWEGLGALGWAGMDWEHWEPLLGALG